MKVFIEFAQDPGLYPKENWFVSRTNIKGGLEDVRSASLYAAIDAVAAEVWSQRRKGTFALDRDWETL